MIFNVFFQQFNGGVYNCYDDHPLCALVLLMKNYGEIEILEKIVVDLDRYQSWFSLSDDDFNILVVQILGILLLDQGPNSNDLIKTLEFKFPGSINFYVNYIIEHHEYDQLKRIVDNFDFLNELEDLSKFKESIVRLACESKDIDLIEAVASKFPDQIQVVASPLLILNARLKKKKGG